MAFENGFIDILKQLVKEQGNDALTDAKRCKAFLADITKNEFKKECRFILQAVEAGAAKAIEGTDDLALCKQAKIKELNDDYGLDPSIAADTVNALALVLRGEQVGVKNPVEVSANKEAVDAFDRGVEQLNKKKDYAKAIEEFSEAIRLDPNYSKAYRYRGQTYFNIKQYDLAINDCTEALRIGPESAMAYQDRGSSYYFGKKQYDLAIKDFTEATKIKPDHAMFYKYRGDCYRMTEQYELAIKDFTEAIRFEPNSAFAYGIRGAAYCGLGQKDLAKQDLEKAISLDPNSQLAKDELKKLDELPASKEAYDAYKKGIKY